MIITRNNRTSRKELLVDETIFSIANGFIGTRGSFAEGYGTDYEYNQTYINGFYNNYSYTYEENLTGFPQVGEKYVNIFDGTKIEFIINGQVLNLSNAKILDLHREYNLEKGYTKRVIKYELDRNVFTLTEKKWVNHTYKDIITTSINLQSDFKGAMEVRTYLVESFKQSKISDPRLHTDEISHLDSLKVNLKDHSIQAKTTLSGLNLCSSMVHDQSFEYEVCDTGIVGKKLIGFINEFTITKHVIHTTDLYDEDYIELNQRLSSIISLISPAELLKTEEKISTLFWDNSQIKIYDNKYVETLLNYNIFQLDRQGGEHIKHNIAAKGISGEGYEGHYFWDTEIYMVPFFILTNPKKAKNLLLYRYQTLDKAREEATNLGYSTGVKFPWRTISGKETSPYYPAGSAQFHINSDIAYTIIKYYQATGDIDFLTNYGFEMMVESARFMCEAVNYYEGEYHLNAVTGPDEYSTVVDDNCYTNQLLQFHLNKTVEYYSKYKSDLGKVIEKLQLQDAEISVFTQIGENISIPFSREKNIFMQDKNFLGKKTLDLESLPKDKFPLLLNYHPLYLYKHQVLKQADTLLSLVLLDFDQVDVLKDTFNYYEPITTHDSSLSKCIYSIAGYQIGYEKMASDYFEEVLETDYENTHDNTEHGLHVANLGGSYLGFVYGLNGIRIHENYLSISPRSNTLMKDYEFKIQYHNETINIKVSDKLRISTTGNVTLKVFNDIVDIVDTYECDLL